MAGGERRERDAHAGGATPPLTVKRPVAVQPRARLIRPAKHARVPRRERRFRILHRQDVDPLRVAVGRHVGVARHRARDAAAKELHRPAAAPAGVGAAKAVPRHVEARGAEVHRKYTRLRGAAPRRQRNRGAREQPRSAAASGVRDGRRSGARVPRLKRKHGQRKIHGAAAIARVTVPRHNCHPRGRRERLQRAECVARTGKCLKWVRSGAVARVAAAAAIDVQRRARTSSAARAAQ